ncbi:MAG TPA: hypothetical protein VEJ39_02325 [Candidatus Acidoferrales bacterium]|nr:hypothetical protein [Candidatus Acidoferrales bacterium]
MPMEVGVRISGHVDLPGIETTFTENVSSHGARVVTSRRWRLDDRLTVATLTGSFHSIARVAYCESIASAGYAVGIQFLEPDGAWVIENREAELQPA